MSVEEPKEELYGMVAEFDDSGQLIEAASHARREGYTAMDAHVPFPIKGLDEALGIRRTILPWLVFAGAVLGGIGGFMLQYWISVEAYPINVGGRPMNSWPSFVPVTFECTILAAGLTTIISLIALSGLPRPYHPVFNTPNFERASNDGYFLSIEATDPKYDSQKTKQFLEQQNPVNVSEISGFLS